MVLSLGLGLAGLVLLAVASDHFVEGASAVARGLRISAVVVGAVVVGLGTAAPEILVSVSAAARGDRSLAVGNMVGSNVANLTLVLGACAVITPVVVHRATLRREVPLAVGAVVLTAVLLFLGGPDRPDGLLLAVALGAALVVLLRAARQDPELAGELEHHGHAVLEHHGHAVDAPGRLSVAVVRTVLGLAGTVAGAQLLVEAALDVADRAGLSTGFVGVTLTAVGTALPELVTSVTAARKRVTTLVVGNLLGSNLFNSLGLGAGVALVGPGSIADDTVRTIALPVMVAASLLAAAAMRRGHAVTRGEGVLLLGAYAAAVALLS